MKRKIMAATAALIIALTSFAACSEKNSSSTASDSKESTVNSIVASDIDASVAAVDYEVGYDESSACKLSLIHI